MIEAKSRFSFPDENAAVIDSLANDTNCLVLVIGVDGIVYWVNQAVVDFSGTPRESLVNAPLSSMFAKPYVDERMQLIREAALTGRPVACDGICRGLFRRTTFRSLAAPGARDAHVLVVCRPLPSDEAALPTAPPARRAKYDDLGPLAVLTEKELEILDLIGRGLSSAQIAAHLGRSVKTIEWHRVALGEKLGASNRVGLARIAMNAGLSAGPMPEPAIPTDATQSDPKQSAPSHPESRSVEPKPTPGHASGLKDSD